MQSGRSIGESPRRRAACLVGWLTIVVGVLVASTPARAWSGSGHEYIASSAWSMMTPAARTMAETLIGSGIDAPGTDCREDDFVAAARWLDCIRGTNQVPPWNEILHADRYPVCDGIFPEGEAPHYSSDALKDAIRTLVDLDGPVDARRAALKIVIHLVGDLHQPLHTATTFDYLGAAREVVVPGEAEPVSLHYFWDIHVARYVRGDGEAAFLALLADERAAIEAGTIDVWCAETADQAWRVAYLELLGDEMLCEETFGSIAIPDAYAETANTLGVRKMAQAAVRLAYILNGVADGSLAAEVYAPRAEDWRPGPPDVIGEGDLDGGPGDAGPGDAGRGDVDAGDAGAAVLDASSLDASSRDAGRRTPDAGSRGRDHLRGSGCAVARGDGAAAFFSMMAWVGWARGRRRRG